MKYRVTFDFNTEPPLTRNQQIRLLDPFVAVLQGIATGGYHLRITTERWDLPDSRSAETCGHYEQEEVR